MLKCVLLDDDPISLTILKKLLSEFKDIQVIAMFQQAIPALQFIKANTVDVVFLDIEMGDVNGLDLVNQLPDRVLTVLVSAHDEYGIQAYTASVCDYVLKPIDKVRFMQTIDKVRDAHKKGTGVNGSADTSIFIRKYDSYIRIFICDINFLKSDGDYVEIHTSDGKFLAIGSMDSVLSKLNSSDFLRVHRSYAVSLYKIDSLQDHNIYIGKHMIPVSKTYINQVKEKLNFL